LENLDSKEYIELKTKKSIKQNQIFHYSRRDPETNKLYKEIKFMRSLIPFLNEYENIKWCKIKSEYKSNDELLKEVELIPQILKKLNENDSNENLTTPFPTFNCLDDHFDEKN
jgi:hypothetical protein